jgi:hypothetical protein
MSSQCRPLCRPSFPALSTAPHPGSRDLDRKKKIFGLLVYKFQLKLSLHKQTGFLKAVKNVPHKKEHCLNLAKFFFTKNLLTDAGFLYFLEGGFQLEQAVSVLGQSLQNKKGKPH